MLIHILLFIVGLILLIKGGDVFVDSSVGIARRFGLSELIIGATVVSLGTTLPEAFVSVGSALRGYGEISYGNAVGSIICNTALIAALSIFIRPSEIDRKLFKIPAIFFFISSAFYVISAYCFGTFSRFTGFILLLLFLIYMFFTVFKSKDSISSDLVLKKDSVTGSENILLFKNILTLVIGAVLISLGANLLIDNGIKLSYALGIPETVIALTFIALGTSLPELTTAVTSLIKGHGSLSLGNIIGANLLNIVFVSGLSVSLSPFDLPSDKLFLGMNSSLILDMPIMIISMLILCIPALMKGKVYRIQGAFLLMIYTVFCFIQFFI